LDFLLEFFDLRALLADDDARSRRPNGDLHAVGRPFNLDFGNPRMIQLILDIFAQENVLLEELAVILLRVPARIPRLDDSQP